jgi:aspartate aminotransferase-like enzyme
MKNVRLFTPGPTSVPQEVLETQARPLVHHRTGVFRKAYLEVIENLRYIMGTGNPVVALASSGTGAMEAAVVNLTKPGEKVLVTVLGKFSDRWRVIANAYGLDVVAVEAEWGRPVTAGQLEEALEKNPGVSVVLTTHSETSTGVLQDVAAFAAVSREHGALVVVDAISSLAAHEVKTDDWELDAVVGGAQKGVMTPPGLAYLSLSPKAIKKIESGRHNCYYFDLLAAVKSAGEGNTPYTPATSLVFALQKALQMIREEGLENVIRRHAANGAAVRAAVKAIGLDLLAAVPCNACTTVVPPDGTAGDIIKTMEGKYGIKIAGGQAHLKGKIVRLGHLGYYGPADMYTMISVLEASLLDLGITTSFGAGVEALQKSFQGEAA